jgi:AraC-like DNA-binding protein
VSTALAVYHGSFGRAALYRLDRPMTPHAHREGHLIFHADGYAGRVNVRGTWHALDGRAAVAVNPWEVHAFEPSPHEASEYFVLYIDPIWFMGTGQGDRKAAIRFGANALSLDDGLMNDIHRIIQRMRRGDAAAGFDIALRGVVEQVFAASWQGSRPPQPILLPAARGTDFRVRKAVRFLADNLANDLELDTVARESGLSRPHFYKMFRSCLGVTPNMCATMMRMEKAVAMLAGSDQSITDIGFEIGFSSQSVFTRVFTANVGMAPSDYRRVATILPD